MILKELLRDIDTEAFFRCMEKREIPKKEQEQYLGLREHLLKIEDISKEDREIVYDIIDNEEIIVALDDGYGYDLFEVPWKTCLGYQVNPEETKKRVNKEDFIYLILSDMYKNEQEFHTL